MGFIERLRQEKESRERAELERIRLERERKEAINKQQQAESQRREARKNQAQEFYNKSGVNFLIDELTKLTNYFARGGYNDDIKQKDKDSVFDGIVWETGERIHIDTNRTAYPQTLIVVETCPDGTIQIHGGFLGSSTIPLSRWENNKDVLEQALEKAWNHLARSTRMTYDYGHPGPCLPGFVLIDTLAGLIPIKNLKVGDSVWTISKFGRKKKARTIQKCRRVIPKNHKIVHLVLRDGRELFVSAYHPTIDGKPIINLEKGQSFDGALISSINLISYKGKYTYDILPTGETGGYWANNILLGSTLFNKSENYVNHLLKQEVNTHGIY